MTGYEPISGMETFLCPRLDRNSDESLKPLVCNLSAAELSGGKGA